MAARLDQLDLRLLACLQEDNLQTSDVLAEKVGRSPSAVARRVRRLRSTGAIVRDVAVVSEKTAGNPLFAVINVQFDRHGPQGEDSLRRSLVASPHVQLCLDIAGAYDLLLLVVARDMDDFNLFTAEQLAGQPAVRRFESTFVKRRVKASLALPMAPLARANGGR
jgi:Lrp/AsnC family transcriptional regulator, leucine-responsive regulatory protein